MGDFSEQQKKFMTELFQQLNTTINEKAAEIRKEFKTQIELVQQDVCSIKSNFDGKISKVKLEHLQNSKVGLERKIKKNNLVLFGINNSEANILKCVINIFKDCMEVPVDERDINDVYRLETRSNNSSPIIVEFLSYQKKREVLQNARKLKGKNISVSRDLCWEDRQINKTLLHYQKQYREKGEIAYIKAGKLVVSNKLYTVEELRNQETLAKEKEEEREQIFTGQKRPLQETEESKQGESEQKKPKQHNIEEIPPKIVTRSQQKN